MLVRLFNNIYMLLGFYTLVSLCVLVFALSRPMYNLDMLAYVGSVKSLETSDKEVIHTFVYSEAKRIVPPENLYFLLGYASLNDYESRVETKNEPVDDPRYIISNDPEALYQQLPFYQIKIMYVSLIYLLEQAGIDIYMATYLISAVSMVLGLWILLFTFRPYVHKYLLYTIPIFAMGYGLLDIARSSTPDGLGFLIITIIVYLFTRSNWLIFIALPLAVLVRPDLIIFGFIILAYYLICNKPWRLFSIAGILASLIFYLGFGYYFGNYGWATLFHHSYVEFFIYPADANFKLGITEILQAYRSEIPKILFINNFWFYIAIMILSLFIILQNYSANEQKQKPYNLMLIVLLSSFLYIIFHYALFPVINSRFFVGQYLLGSIILLYLMSEKFIANARG